MKYAVVLHKDPGSAYGVTVPDLPGCFSAGDTIDEALENAHEAIECPLQGLLLDNDPIPQPKSIEEHKANPDYKNGIWAFVDFDLAKFTRKAKRINITVPEFILAKVDNYIQKKGISRSNFLTQAALKEISK